MEGELEGRERKGGREAGIGRGGKSSKGDGKERRRGRSKRWGWRSRGRREISRSKGSGV